MLNAMDAAKYVINLCAAENEPISNLQLQTILYYIQAAFYKHFGRPCFDDNFEAWMFGPVLPEVYYQYCGAGVYDINLRYQEYNDIWSDEE